VHLPGPRAVPRWDSDRTQARAGVPGPTLGRLELRSSGSKLTRFATESPDQHPTTLLKAPPDAATYCDRQLAGLAPRAPWAKGLRSCSGLRGVPGPTRRVPRAQVKRVESTGSQALASTGRRCASDRFGLVGTPPASFYRGSTERVPRPGLEPATGSECVRRFLEAESGIARDRRGLPTLEIGTKPFPPHTFPRHAGSCHESGSLVDLASGDASRIHSRRDAHSLEPLCDDSIVISRFRARDLQASFRARKGVCLWLPVDSRFALRPHPRPRRARSPWLPSRRRSMFRGQLAEGALCL